MSRFPGANWVPSPYHGATRQRGRAFVLHVAVANVEALAPRSNASWHFYVAKNGKITQYIDTDHISWATGDGNPTVVSAETEGGVVNANIEEWTGSQIESLAQIFAWLHKDEGIPLRLMSDSRRESRGLGYHRLGIDPWRVSGGELWSSAKGKICPGEGKIKQMTKILYRALQIVDGPTVPAPTERIDTMQFAIYSAKGGTAAYLGGPGVWKALTGGMDWVNTATICNPDLKWHILPSEGHLLFQKHFCLDDLTGKNNVVEE